MCTGVYFENHSRDISGETSYRAYDRDRGTDHSFGGDWPQYKGSRKWALPIRMDAVLEKKMDIFPSNLKNLGHAIILIVVAHSSFKKTSYIPREIIRIPMASEEIIRMCLLIISSLKDERHDSCAYHGCINIK